MMQRPQQACSSEGRQQAVRPRRTSRPCGPQRPTQQGKRHHREQREHGGGALQCRRRHWILWLANMQQLEQQYANTQLPQPRTGGVERPRWRCLAQAQHRRMQQRPHADHGKQAQAHPTPARAACPGQEQQREQQVELLFHAQRPGMGVGIEFGLGREIIVADQRQYPVAEAEERHQPGLVTGLAEPGLGNEQHAGNGGQQQAADQRRCDAADTARIEAQHRLPQRQRWQPVHRRADHETGNDEEHIYASEPARQPGRVQVEHDDGQHGNRAQTVNVRHVATAWISGHPFPHNRGGSASRGGCVLTRPGRPAPGTAGRRMDLPRPARSDRPSGPPTRQTLPRTAPAPRR